MTPAMLKKVVYAGTHLSFEKASKHLSVMAEVKMSPPRVHRATQAIGNERATEKVKATAKYEAMPIPAMRKCPKGVTVPMVACIQMDGGRLQVRPRMPSDEPESVVVPVAEEQSSAPEQEDNASASERKGKFWRESKVGCLLSMTSDVLSVDPNPTIPEVFVDPARIQRLCIEIKGNSSRATERGQSTQTGTGNIEEPPTDLGETEPKIKSRHVVASRIASQAFGARLAAVAYSLGFNAAQRKSFVCDGQSANWNVWSRWFSTYVPIVDFIHAICYVYAAAMAGVKPEDGWSNYLQWAQWLWNGEAEKIIESLTAEQSRIGKPELGELSKTPRSIIAECLTYLTNQKSRMNYPEYRRQGLPTSSVYVESTIKQINKRVKSTEKFWDSSTEAILNLSADYLCPDSEMDEFWMTRPSSIASNRQWHPQNETAT